MLLEPPACQCSRRLGGITDLTLLFIWRVFAVVAEHLSSLFSLSLSHPVSPPSPACLSPKMGHWEVSIIRITLHKTRHTHAHKCMHSRTHPCARLPAHIQRCGDENLSPTGGFQTCRAADIHVSWRESNTTAVSIEKSSWDGKGKGWSSGGHVAMQREELKTESDRQNRWLRKWKHE